MNNIVTLAEVKKHLNIDPTFTDDDNYITSLIVVATERTEQHLDIKFDDVYESANDVHKTIKHAIMLVVGELYKKREMTTDVAPTDNLYGFSWLLSNFKNYSF